MIESEHKTPESAELTELRSQCHALGRQVMTLLMALFVVSGTLTVFLGVQARRVGKDLDFVRPQAKDVLERSAKEAPVITKFMAQLADYGRTHSDFAPIMIKYRLGTNAAAYMTNAVAPAAGAATPAAAPKK